MRRNAKKIGSRFGLGPSGAIFTVVTILILCSAIYTQANLLFWAFGLMVGGLVVSILWSWRALRGLEVQRLLPAHGVAGEPTVIRYHIINRSWLPVFSLTVHETWGRGPRGWRRTGPIAADPPLLSGRPYGWVLHLGPGQATQAEAPCHPRVRGTLHLSRIVLGTSFPFSIIRKSVIFEQPGELLIYPHLYRMNRRVISGLAQSDTGGQKHVDRRGGHEEFFGLRDYRPGDSLKLIDWKRSARTRRLVAKEMTQPAPPRILLRLDLTPRGDSGQGAKGPRGRGKDKRGRGGGGALHSAPGPLGPSAPSSAPSRVIMEQAISLTASVICDAYLHGYQVGLTVAGYACPAFPVHHSLPHRTRMLEALAGMDLDTPSDETLSVGEPSVVIWTGEDGGGRTVPGRATVLGASAIEQYVVEASPQSLLHRRVRGRSRRDRLTKS